MSPNFAVRATECIVNAGNRRATRFAGDTSGLGRSKGASATDRDYGASLFALENGRWGDVDVTGCMVGLSMRPDQDLYKAKRVKIAIPEKLTKICIQIASVVSVENEVGSEGEKIPVQKVGSDC